MSSHRNFHSSYFEDDIVPRIRLEKEVNVSDFHRGADFTVDPNVPPELEEEEGIYKGEEVYKYLNPEFNDDTDDDEELNFTGDGSFERWEHAMEDITELKDNGVLKKVIKEGCGDLVKPTSFVTVCYNGYLEGIDEPFDSTYLRGCPKKFTLRSGAVVPGLDIAAASMKKGETSRFLIKPEYFLGPQGCPPRIPPNVTVMFVVELVNWIEDGGADAYYSMTADQRREATFVVVGKVAEREKNEGNDFYKADSPKLALQCYNRAIRLCEECRLKDAEEEKNQRQLLFQLYRNAALAGLKLSFFKGVMANINKALEFDVKDVKCLYIKGKALHGLRLYDQAKEALENARQLKPNDKDINNELTKLNLSMKRSHSNEKKIYSKMFSGSGYIEEKSGSKKSREYSLDDEEFRSKAYEQLLSFKNNKQANTLPLPSNLSAIHLSIIDEITEKLGLDVDQTHASDANNAHFTVIKCAKKKF